MALRKQRAEDLENDLNKGALWAVTYGDLMSYLMIFFLIMFSFSIGKKAGGGKGEQKKQAEKMEESLANIQRVFGGKPDPKLAQRKQQEKSEEDAAQRLTQVIEDKNLTKFAEVKQTEEKVTIVLKEPILFDSGRAELKPAAANILQEISAELKQLSNPIVIEGHTDNVPIRGGHYKSNWELSMARAYAVIRFFEAAGVDPKRMAGVGYGEHRPAADNATPEGKAMNRRIGIDLLRGG